MKPVLLADRFVRLRPGEVVDLATARRVWIRRVAPGGRADVTAWLNRCAALATLWHPAFVPLADFGAVGRRGYFEAWDSASPPSSGTNGPRLMPQPASASGARGSEVAEQEARTLARALEDLFDSRPSWHPSGAVLHVPGGPRQVVLVHLAARTARSHGYVPVNARLLDRAGEALLPVNRWRALVDGRHVMVLEEGTVAAGGDAVSLFFLSLGLSSDRPHVWLTFKSQSPRPTPTGAAFASDAGKPALVREERGAYLARTRLPATARDPAAGLITDAILSGRHAQAERLLRARLGRFSRRRDEAESGAAALALGRLLLVRGRAACAGRILDEARERFERASLPAPAVHAAIFVGLAWTDAGRLGPAEAALRAAEAAASRLMLTGLSDLAHLALARCLYWQGRVTEASDCLALSSRRGYGPPPDDGGRAASPIAGRSGVLYARERLCGAEPPHPSIAGLDDAWAVGEISCDVARACLDSRVALAAHDVERAGCGASEARELAERSGDVVGLAAACTAKAAVYCALGDLPAVREAVDTGLQAARRAHAPLRALRLRILLAKGCQAAGQDRDARRWLERLSRLDPARLPRVVGLPLERIIRGDDPPPVVGTSAAPRQPRARFVTGAPLPTDGVRDGDAVKAILDLLLACQSSEDDEAALGRVTAMLRRGMRAAAVACVGRVRDTDCVLAAEGREIGGAALARRAIESELAIAPTATASGLEAAMPVRFAGTVVGAFVCRFAADAPPNWSAVHPVLAAAAAAVGPCVRAAADARALPALQPDAAVGEVLGTSESVAALRRAVLRAAGAPFNVLIEGESGSGKELVARAIHRLGPRRDRPLCALNCAALTDDLVEAELFGHARGAFTGAIAERKGIFEEADHGVLVLDEVGELTARAQAKLLRAIQEGEVRRVGENFSRPVDVRIVAATNRPLGAAVEAGLFRRDLLYRLEVIRIVVPPLRERPGDIPLLAGHFWREATARVGSRATLSPATLAALSRYDWPGNVRELQNVMASLAVSAGRRGSIGPDRLPPAIGGRAAASGAQTMADARRALEAGMVRAALARAGGHRARAARELGLTRQGLAKLMVRLKIE
jgi:DNA-binding NtrC family response regulator/tetratricopeptide (TPR) repeat protein